MHLLQRFQQQARHRSQAGADFNHRVIGSWIDRADDVVQYQVIGQEVLTEALAGDVFHCLSEGGTEAADDADDAECFATTICAATFSASSMLP